MSAEIQTQQESGIQDTPNADLTARELRPIATKALRALKPRIRAFVRAYCGKASHDACAAYRATIGWGGGPDGLKVQASRLRHREDVARAISALDELLCEDATREELLTSLAKIARADPTDLMDDEGSLDMVRARETRLLKDVRVVGTGKMVPVMYDRLEAWRDIAKIKGFAAPTKLELGVSLLERAIRAADEAEKAENTVDAEVVRRRKKTFEPEEFPEES